jgi:hypothetical protein
MKTDCITYLFYRHFCENFYYFEGWFCMVFVDPMFLLEVFYSRVEESMGNDLFEAIQQS